MSTTQPVTIPRKAAKDELERIDKILTEPLILIGGLAVQQYYEPRDTQDIDLICSFETSTDLIGKLYPSHDWKIENVQSDDRPKYIISHRVYNLTIIFGPKIEERGEYQYLSWSSLSKGAKPFRHSGVKYLEKIRVPLPHFLAYSKLVSFINRREKSPEKANQDLEDFVNLTNNEIFSISRLCDIIRQHGAEQRLLTEMTTIISNNTEAWSKLKDSSIFFFARFWNDVEPKQKSPEQWETSAAARKTIYLSAPHSNEAHNERTARALREVGFTVKVPLNEVKEKCGTGSPGQPDLVRQICIDAIVSSQILVVDIDKYGLDSAWEMGFAEGLGKFVVGFNSDIALKNLERLINRRPYIENFMHGWHMQKIYSDPEELAKEYQDKVIYVCGSFANESRHQFEKALDGKVRKLIVPEKYVPRESEPRYYPLQTRANAINQVDECDVLAVVLPRYGMDASWQIGYATAKKKTVVGIIMRDGAHASRQSVWDHWMHGWKEKDIFTDTSRLSAALRGYVEFGVV